MVAITEEKEMNNKEEIDFFIKALKEIIEEYATN